MHIHVSAGSRRLGMLLSAALCGALFFSPGSPAAGSEIEFLSSQKGNIFVGEHARLALALNKIGLPQGAVALVEIRDESGNMIQQVAVDLRAAHPVVRINGAGYYSLDVSIQNYAGTAPLMVGKTSLAIIPKSKPDPASPFGIWHVHGDPAIGLEAGAHWTRLMYTLRGYRLDGQGKVVPAPKRGVPPRGYSVIGVLANGLPEFLNARENSASAKIYPPTNWPLFEKSIEQFARDLPYFPQYFSVYNEPDASWSGSPEELVRLLSTIGFAIKKVHPGTRILGPGFYSINIAQLRKFAALGLFDHLDGLMIHAYVDGTEPEAEFIERVRNLKKFLAEIGRPQMPIYITEFGWTSSAGTWQKPVSELTQARYAARALALLRNEGVKAAIYFCLLYRTSNPGEAGFSVLRQDGEPKPAYVSIATAVRMLGHEGKTSLVENGDGSRLLQLSSGDKAGATLMIWDKEAGGHFFIPGNLAKSAINMMGREVALGGGVEVGESPLYLVTKAKVSYPPVRLDPVRVRRGKTISVSALRNISVPQPFRITDKERVSVPADTSAGTYWLMGVANRRITILPVVVRD